MNNITDLKTKITLFSVSILKKYGVDNPDNGSGSSIKILDSWVENIDEFDYLNQNLDFLSKQYDIRGKIHRFYDSGGKAKGEDCLGLDEMQIFSGFLFLRVLEARKDSKEFDKLAKYINVCWKVFDGVDLPDFLLEAPKKLSVLQNEMFGSLKYDVQHQQSSSLASVLRVMPADDSSFSILPIDVFFYENPIARAYLEMLYSLRLKPRRLVHLIPERDIATKKRIGRLLPSNLRQIYLHSVQASKISYWPKHLLKNHKVNCDNLFEELEKTLQLKKSSIRGLANLQTLERFCDDIIKVSYDGFKDERFLEAIKETPSQLVLFTGGGIIPKKVFDNTDAKILHIHPGYLPDIKGADCFYWSSMLAGRPSASCFVMNSGIDTGDIINAKFLPKLNLSASTQELNEQMIYRLIYSFVDPWVRAAVLRDTILYTDKFNSISPLRQDYTNGITFHFMHKKMREQITNSFFRKYQPIE